MHTRFLWGLIHNKGNLVPKGITGTIKRASVKPPGDYLCVILAFRVRRFKI